MEAPRRVVVTREGQVMSEERLSCERPYLPIGFREKTFDARPSGKQTIDYVWAGHGPWSLVVQTTSGKRVTLLTQLTKREICQVSEALRGAGYEVDGQAEIGC